MLLTMLNSKAATIVLLLRCLRLLERSRAVSLHQRQFLHRPRHQSRAVVTQLEVHLHLQVITSSTSEGNPHTRCVRVVLFVSGGLRSLCKQVRIISPNNQHIGE